MTPARDPKYFVLIREWLKDSQTEMIFVGGGAGMAPLRSHLFHLFHTLKTGRKVSYWYGARSKREMFYDDHFKAIEEKFSNFSYNVALSDPMGSALYSHIKNDKLESTGSSITEGIGTARITKNWADNVFENDILRLSLYKNFNK